MAGDESGNMDHDKRHRPDLPIRLADVIPAAMVAALNAEKILFTSILSRFEWTLRFEQ